MTKRCGIIAASLLLAGGVLFAQTPAPLAFEVASIKVAEPITPAKVQAGKLHIGMTVDGARVDIGFFGLRELIMTAYGVKQNQIMGPDWMSSQRFDISAKIPDGVSKDKVPEMLQTLLAERFGLKFHRESKEQAMFALVVAKGGSKMKEAEAEAAPVAVAPGAAPPPPPGPGQSFTVGTANGQASVRVAQNGNGGATMTMSGGGGRGGNIKMNMVDGMMRMEMSSISMPAFAEAITRFVDKPVVDQTELKGNYQIALDMTMADMMAVAKATMGGMGMAMGPEKPGGPGGAAGGAGEASDPAGGSIFSSVQKLGLRLEPKKSPVDILVVDHLEKNPGEN